MEQIIKIIKSNTCYDNFNIYIDNKMQIRFIFKKERNEEKEKNEKGKKNKTI